MDFKVNEEQMALKRQFRRFFREEMKHAPVEYVNGSTLEAAYASDAGWAFTQSMRKKLVDKGWMTMAWPRGVRWP